MKNKRTSSLAKRLRVLRAKANQAATATQKTPYLLRLLAILQAIKEKKKAPPE
jgi:hypothetical protein